MNLIFRNSIYPQSSPHSVLNNVTNSQNLMASTILNIVIIGFVVLLLILAKRFRQQKAHFKNKENKLLDTMQSIQKEQLELDQKVKLSDDFTANYQKSKSGIAQTIYEANVALLEKISDKNKTIN